MIRKNVIKISRKSFLWNYSVASILLLSLVLYNAFYEGVLAINFFFVASIVFLLKYPEVARVYRSFIIDKDKIIEDIGIITKKRVMIPLQSVSHITMNKGILGKFFDYGDVIVTGFSGGVIKLKGIDKPENVAKRIEDLIKKFKDTESVFPEGVGG